MLNKVMIIGNLGRDPEIRQAGDSPVANFSVAVNERFKDRNGNQQDRTEWVNVVAWGRLSDIVAKYIRKGSSVFVEGKLQTRSWETKQGEKRYTTEVVASLIQMLGSKQNDNFDQRREEENHNQMQHSETTPQVDDDLPF